MPYNVISNELNAILQQDNKLKRNDELHSLIKVNAKIQKIGISQERLEACMPVLRQQISFWREYPDLFVDFMCGADENGNKPKETLNLFFYQRVFLRAAIRHRMAYCVFPRAYSKSFLSFLTLLVRCVLYPGAQLFVTTGGKAQAASIAKEKVNEICKLVPGLHNEINWARGASKESKDYVEYIFKNGSNLAVVATSNATRGQRKTGGLMEEVILIDGQLLNEVILPLMNVDRLLPDGTRHEEENVNKSQIYITTAGFKQTFAYQKLIEIVIQQLINPEAAIVLGGTWRVPVMEHLLSKNFVNELKDAGTYNEDSFAREYESHWVGDSENAFFSSDNFDKNRILLQPEYEYSGRTSKSGYYVLSVDVGRKGCTSEVCVWKVTPQVQGASIKSLVMLYSYDEEHFGIQAARLKALYYKYKARKLVIDANGLGIGLVDFMVIPSTDPDTGDVYPPFGVDNDEEGFYKKFKTPDTELNAMWLIKANAPINTEAHTNAQTQLSSGKVKLLVDQNTAKAKLLATKRGQEMTVEERNKYLMPYTMTSILKEQMGNLIEENEGVNIILKQKNKAVSKDRFSAFEYGLYYIKLEEDSKKRRRGNRMKDMMFFN